MSTEEQQNLVEHFSGLSDPRGRQNREHKFIDILVITICAAICGADDWVSVEQFGCAKQGWFEGFLELPNGIPSHDTFWRVFRHLEAEQFQASFMQWIASVQTLTQGEVIAVDGKQLRRSHDGSAGKAAIHMVSAWASRNGLVLGQRKVDEKSNEITAIPDLLQKLEISGCIVTIDAMGCRTQLDCQSTHCPQMVATHNPGQSPIRTLPEWQTFSRNSLLYLVAQDDSRRHSRHDSHPLGD